MNDTKEHYCAVNIEKSAQYRHMFLSLADHSLKNFSVFYRRFDVISIEILELPDAMSMTLNFVFTTFIFYGLLLLIWHRKRRYFEEERGNSQDYRFSMLILCLIVIEDSSNVRRICFI